MKRTIITSLVIFLVGMLIGAGGQYVVKEAIPAREAKITAHRQQQHQELGMVKPEKGVVTFVDADTIIVDGEIFRTDENTTVQVGMSIKNVEGQKTDLADYLEPGDSFDILYEGNRILAIYRDLRPDGS